jgi:hypothetical protein
MTWWQLALVMWIAVSLALATVPVALRRSMLVRGHHNADQAAGAIGVDRRGGHDRRSGRDRRSAREDPGTRMVERRRGPSDRRRGRDRRRTIASI